MEQGVAYELNHRGAGSGGKVRVLPFDSRFNVRSSVFEKDCTGFCWWSAFDSWFFANVAECLCVRLGSLCWQWLERFRYGDALHVVVIYRKPNHEERAKAMTERVAKRILNPISTAMEFTVASRKTALPYFRFLETQKRLPIAIAYAPREGDVFVADQQVGLRAL